MRGSPTHLWWWTWWRSWRSQWRIWSCKGTCLSPGNLPSSLPIFLDIPCLRAVLTHLGANISLLQEMFIPQSQRRFTPTKTSLLSTGSSPGMQECAQAGIYLCRCTCYIQISNLKYLHLIESFASATFEIFAFSSFKSQVCTNVPQQECHSVPRQKCRNVPTKKCDNVPRQVRRCSTKGSSDSWSLLGPFLSLSCRVDFLIFFMNFYFETTRHCQNMFWCSGCQRRC